MGDGLVDAILAEKVRICYADGDSHLLDVRSIVVQHSTAGQTTVSPDLWEFIGGFFVGKEATGQGSGHTRESRSSGSDRSYKHVLRAGEGFELSVFNSLVTSEAHGLRCALDQLGCACVLACIRA